MNNTLFSIEPYWTGRTSAFDFPKIGLLSEPFIAGLNTILTKLAQEHLGIEPREGTKFQLIFSCQEFPGFHLRCQRRDSEFSGYWYITEHKDWGWFCPTMNKFFVNRFPEEIYMKVLKA
jgi:hypothetical protein